MIDPNSRSAELLNRFNADLVRAAKAKDGPTFRATIEAFARLFSTEMRESGVTLEIWRAIPQDVPEVVRLVQLRIATYPETRCAVVVPTSGMAESFVIVPGFGAEQDILSLLRTVPIELVRGES